MHVYTTICLGWETGDCAALRSVLQSKIDRLGEPQSMMAPEIPHNEAARLDTLRALKILDTSREERFDRLTRLARRVLDVPIALVSLVDEERQWFKSCIGLDASETPRNISFCGHAILGDDAFIVEDTTDDERFCDNPLLF